MGMDMHQQLPSTMPRMYRNVNVRIKDIQFYISSANIWPICIVVKWDTNLLSAPIQSHRVASIFVIRSSSSRWWCGAPDHMLYEAMRSQLENCSHKGSWFYPGGGGGGGGVLTIFWVTGRLGPFDPPFSTYVEFWHLLLGSDVEYWPPFFKHCRILTPIFQHVEFWPPFSDL